MLRQCCGYVQSLDADAAAGRASFVVSPAAFVVVDIPAIIVALALVVLESTTKMTSSGHRGRGGMHDYSSLPSRARW